MTARKVDGEGVQLSVGIPAYNQSHYLRETLESLLAQTVPPSEIVVSENHSTDDTAAVLDAVCDGPGGDAIRIVRPSRHLGMMASWNFLAQQLQGNWFALLSSDDVALPTYVETLCRAAARVPDAVLAYSDCEEIDGDGAVSRVRKPRDLAEISRPPDTLTQQLAAPLVSFTAFAVRRSAFDDAGGFREDLTLAGDWALWMRLAPLGAFVHEKGFISRYRFGYRSRERECAMALHWARDEQTLFREIAADVARALSLDPAVIDTASRTRCYRQLARDSELMQPGEREEAAELLREWAQSCGLEREWQRFRAGERLPRKSAGRVRRFARALARIIHEGA